MARNWPPAATFQLLGKSIARVDAPEIAQGAAKYTADIIRPGMLYGEILGSPRNIFSETVPQPNELLTHVMLSPPGHTKTAWPNPGRIVVANGASGPGGTHYRREAHRRRDRAGVRRGRHGRRAFLQHLAR